MNVAGNIPTVNISKQLVFFFTPTFNMFLLQLLDVDWCVVIRSYQSELCDWLFTCHRQGYHSNTLHTTCTSARNIL